MGITAHDLADWTRNSIRQLAAHPKYGSVRAVAADLAKRTGLSESYFLKIHSGEISNPTIRTVDLSLRAVMDATREASSEH